MKCWASVWTTVIAALAYLLAFPALGAETLGRFSGPTPLPSAKFQYVTLTNWPADDSLLSDAKSRRVEAVAGELLVRFRPTTTRTRQQAMANPWAASVKFYGQGAPQGRQLLAPVRAAPTNSTLDQLALVKLRPGLDLDQALQHFRSRPEVVYAEPNFRLQIAQASPAPVLPDDFDFAQLWGFRNVGQGEGLAGADIRAPEAWAYTTGDRRVQVAVIDTGIDYYHPDLAANIWTNPKEIPGNGIDDDGNGFIDDVHGFDFVSDDSDPLDDLGHGTHVAGTIGAVGNNQVGVVGLCWQVSIMAVKVFDETGNGSIDTAIEGIRYAVRNGARIVNASWGSYERSSALEDVIKDLHQEGVIFVAAAGNDNSQNAFYPAAYKQSIGVAALTAQGFRARFSNFGTFVALAAPGENIYSTLPNNSYGYYSGTSMAAPHVTGLAALVLSRHFDFTNDQVENILRNAVDVINTDQYVGTGRIDAASAVRVNTPLPQVKLSLPATLSGTVDISGTATGNDFSSYVLEYGKGSNPTNWTSFFSSVTPVASGPLFKEFSTPQLEEGPYTFRLTARNAAGEQATERAAARISNVHITFPMHEDVLRSGDKLQIIGTVFGEGRTYQLQYGLGPDPKEWTSAGIELTGAGQQPVQEGLLAVWDTRLVEPNQFYSLKLTATAHDGTTTEFLTRLVYLDPRLRPGWPQYLPTAGEFPSENWRDITVADIDQDSTDELIMVDHGNSDGAPARLLVYRYDGSLFWSQDLGSGFPYADIPVVGDVDGDGLMEIFVDAGSDQLLYAFRHDGTPLPGHWPVQLEATALGKVLADLDGDGKKELIGYSQNSVDRGGTAYRQLVVYDLAGNLLRKWYVPDCDAQMDAPKIFPAVGNLDAEPDLEIVAVSGCDTVAAFKLSKEGSPIWSTQTYGTFVASPVIGDLDGDRSNEVVIGAFDMSGGERGGLYAFDSKGNPLPGWPVLLEESFSATPALADFLQDGQREICIPSWKSRLLHLVRRNGFEVSGWPVGPIDTSSLRSSPVIGDIDGDGSLDVVLPSPGRTSQLLSGGSLSLAGGVKAWSVTGQSIPLNGAGKVWPLVMESASGDWAKAPPVTLADLDHNGKLDVIAATVRDRTYLPAPEKSSWKQRSSLYVWELETSYKPERLPWPTFQANAQHTGYLPAPEPKNQPPLIGDIPDQIVPAGAAFYPIQLDQFVDDPDNRPKDLTWHVSGAKDLVVSIDANRVATIKASGNNWTGLERIYFSVRDPAGEESGVTVSFEARLGYVPPIAQGDRVTTPEDVPVDVDVLANDSDPTGQPLTIASFSKPNFGRLTRTPHGTLLYTPKLYFYGVDRFSYMLSNGKGGVAMGDVIVEVTPVNHPPTANPVNVITDQDVPLDIDILAEAADPDGDPTHLVGLLKPEHGSVTQNADQTVHYVPPPLYYGMDTFDYVVADSAGDTNQGTVTVMIKPINHPPVAQDQELVLNRNSSVNITFAATDPDPKDTALTFEVLDSPKYGVLWTYPAVATYYPTNGFSGTDSFTYRANDGKEDGPVATVTLTVIDANNLPNAADQSVVTKVDHPVTIRLGATDLDDDPLTYQLLTLPTHGTLTESGTNYLYAPAPQYLGTDLFTFQASDGRGTSRVATVTITVTDQNTPPEAQDLYIQTTVNSPTNITLSAIDLESDHLNFHIVTRPSKGKLIGKGEVLLYSPNAAFTGSDRFTYKADDGDLESNVATVSIGVEVQNHAPVTTNQEVVVFVNTPTPVQLRVTDAESDPLNCPILKGPKFGRLSGLGTNMVYTPRADFLGGDSFTYKAWDGHVYSREAKVTVTVSPVPSSPPVFESITSSPGRPVSLVLATPSPKPAQILVSSNLVHWVPLQGLAPIAGGTNTVVDPQAANFSRRFYRAQQNP